MSKTGLGVLFCLFFSVIGLLVGICLYPSGSYERETFVSGWVGTFVTAIVLVVILAVVAAA